LPCLHDWAYQTQSVLTVPGRREVDGVPITRVNQKRPGVID
jgi:hypothetical protein